VAVGFRGVSLYDERKYTLEVISALLSGRDGILFDIVREDAGLAYTSGASNMAHPEEGYFLLYAATTRENLERAEEKILSALNTVISGNITDDDIVSSRKRSIADHARSLESNSAVAGTMALSELYGLGAMHYEEYNEGISKVTRDDIIRVAGEILDPEHAAVLKIRSDL
jgi:zinc protease